MKLQFAKYLLYAANLIILIYIVLKLFVLEHKLDTLLQESDLNNSKMDYLDSDINKRNVR